jgi:hypothetical protein
MPVTIETTLLYVTEKQCSGAFVTHTLDHITTVPGGDQVRMFEANGGGVGLGDLDNDGDLEIVLANHAEKNTILWNEGNLNFRTERMAQGDSRAVTLVDVDADGWLDIVFTRRASAPNYWHNLGNGEFQLEVMPGISIPLYAITWADFDGDTDLDLVGATYDAGLLNDLGQNFLAGSQAGVYYYENHEGHFAVTRLADRAQALALMVFDLDSDGHLEILVGNDFVVPDQVWHLTEEGWQEWKLFATTTRNTMSFDLGDINNDGRYELFATDMKPFTTDAETRAAWTPVIRSIRGDERPQGDPQIAENVLQVAGTENSFVDEAMRRGVDATGWSWSGKFGDLDQDGFLDLYVVNGMMEATTFAHLPNHELVEANQAFHNDGTGHFERMLEWGLASLASGRGMSMADLDMDDDLDIVVNNLRGPAELFENQLCTGNSLQVELFWPDSGNTRAIGARLILHTAIGDLHRDIRAASGYLSGDSARVHFGFPEGTELGELEIHWPDGEVTLVEKVSASELMKITRAAE